MNIQFLKNKFSLYLKNHQLACSQTKLLDFIRFFTDILSKAYVPDYRSTWDNLAEVLEPYHAQRISKNERQFLTLRYWFSVKLHATQLLRLE